MVFPKERLKLFNGLLIAPLGDSYKDALIKRANHRNWTVEQIFQPPLHQL